MGELDKYCWRHCAGDCAASGSAACEAATLSAARSICMRNQRVAGLCQRVWRCRSSRQRGVQWNYSRELRGYSERILGKQLGCCQSERDDDFLFGYQVSLEAE